MSEASGNEQVNSGENSGGGPDKVNEEPLKGSGLVKKQRWKDRRSVHSLKKLADHEPGGLHQEFEKRENDRTRLPVGETAHFGAVMFAEAFTPSTVSRLYESLEDGDRRRHGVSAREQLRLNRQGQFSGWQNLGYVRRPGQFSLNGKHDPNLPEFVDAAWVKLHYLTASLSIVVTTFTIKENHGDLSGVLRTDYRDESGPARIRVFGFAGPIRSRIPFSRPKRFRVESNIRSAFDAKREAAFGKVEAMESACHRWLSKEYPGRFAQYDRKTRPTIRVFLIGGERPFQDKGGWLSELDLDRVYGSWESVNQPGWFLSEYRGIGSETRSIVTVAARRDDVQVANTQDPTSVWSVTQKFHDSHSPLAVKVTLASLLSIYDDRLGEIRDNAQSQKFPRRPVKEAKRLEEYLMGDGLDASVVIQDILEITKDVTKFRGDTPEYRERVPEVIKARLPRAAGELGSSMRDSIRHRATSLENYTKSITENFRASAELRQAITNARLQRAAAALSILALVAAVLALVK
ncbi:hypothetical protein [Amycolatopsis orientalis]|uniref:hypothetical protein n=1 Tax=Amycolatopsis orientalis TaxID=31958 RepID=UPI001319FD61|nr:hypothetical protein [Amycolatopsis orientalis]